jgi:hypothetical protein
MLGFREKANLASPSSRRKPGSSAFGTAKTLDPGFRRDDGEVILNITFDLNGTLLLLKT